MNSHDDTMSAPAVAGGQYSSMLTAFESFPQMMQVSDALAHSSIVPQRFQNDPGSVLIALDMAARAQLNPLMVMQNLYTVYGTPSFSGKFALTLLRRCGLFSRLVFEYREEGNWRAGVRVAALSADGGHTDYGPWIDERLAAQMGWLQKKDSMWGRMGDQMARYRAASWFANTNCPEVLMGLPTKEEVEEAPEELRNVTPKAGAVPLRAARPALKAAAAAAPAVAAVGGLKPPASSAGAAAPAAVDDVRTDAAAPVGDCDGDEAEQAKAAFDWLNGSVRAGGATWAKVYKVMDALGFKHPAMGAPKAELAQFALWVFRSQDAREALEQSGFVFNK